MSEQVQVEAAQGPTPMTEVEQLRQLVGHLAKLTHRLLELVPEYSDFPKDEALARSNLVEDLECVAEACGVDPTI